MLQFLKLAVRNRLRTALCGASKPLPATASSWIQLGGPSGEPQAPFPDLSIIVSGGDRSNSGDPLFYGLEEMMGWNVNINLRESFVPHLRIGDVTITNPTDGVEWLGEFVIGALHGYIALATDANTLATASSLGTRGEFIAGIPPRFVTANDCIERSQSWWGASRQDSGKTCGVSYQLVFTGIKMIRYIGDIAPA